MFGRERESVDTAFPGDVIGIISPGLLTIGDTVTTGKPIDFAKVPTFPPEHFALLVNSDVTRFKQFNKGLAQLEEEGTIQVLHSEDALRREPIVAAVGELQFDVVLARLEEEYGVTAQVQRLGFHRRQVGQGGRAAPNGCPYQAICAAAGTGSTARWCCTPPNGSWIISRRRIRASP